MAIDCTLTEEEKRLIKYYCGYLDEMIYISGDINKISHTDLFEEQFSKIDPSYYHILLQFVVSIRLLEDALENTQDLISNLPENLKSQVPAMWKEFEKFQNMLCQYIGVPPGPHIKTT